MSFSNTFFILCQNFLFKNKNEITTTNNKRNARISESDQNSAFTIAVIDTILMRYSKENFKRIMKIIIEDKAF